MPMISTGYTTIDEYIELFPEETRKVLRKVREVIRKAAPEAIEKIGYGIPTFVLGGNLVHFAAYKNHIGFYPGAVGIDAFKEELSSFEGSKGTIRFPLNKPIPYDLIERITKFRVMQNLEKSKSRKSKR